MFNRQSIYQKLGDKIPSLYLKKYTYESGVPRFKLKLASQYKLAVFACLICQLFFFVSCSENKNPSQNSKAAEKRLESPAIQNQNTQEIYLAALESQQKGDIKQAVNYYQELLRIKDDHGEAHVQLAGIYLQVSELNLALDHLLKAQRSFPESSQIANNIGSVYTKQKKWDFALKYYKSALDLSKDEGEKELIKTNMGQVCFQFALQKELEKDLKSAKDLYQLAIYYIPKFNEAIKQLGMIYLKEGNFLKALETFKMSDEINRPDQIITVPEKK